MMTTDTVNHISTTTLHPPIASSRALDRTLFPPRVDVASRPLLGAAGGDGTGRHTSSRVRVATRARSIARRDDDDGFGLGLFRRLDVADDRIRAHSRVSFIRAFPRIRAHSFERRARVASDEADGFGFERGGDREKSRG